MNTFIGTKMIKAKPMNRLEYNQYRGLDLPSDENGEDEGMLVEYIDGGKSNHPNHEGYISWSPIDVFNRAYRPIDGITFGQAIEALKQGKRVAREGWNGKGMWLALSFGNPSLPSENFWNPHNKDFARQNGGSAEVLSTITMKTADNKILMGWLASQTDMLAEDWVILD